MEHLGTLQRSLEISIISPINPYESSVSCGSMIPSQGPTIQNRRRPSPRRDAVDALSERRAVSPLFEDRGQ